MNKDALCRAFCADVDVQSVPVGLAVRTPFTRPDGDFLAFYVRKNAVTGQVRLEDDGGTIAFLESHGVDLDTDSRRELFVALLNEFAAHYDEGEVLIHTPEMREEELGPRALAFAEMMLRLYDMLFTSAKRVSRSFKEDLGKLIEHTFQSGHTIEAEAYFNEDMRDYVADYIIRAPGGGALAVFAGTSDVKALEALLFWREMRERRVAGVKAMLVLERPKPPAIKDRTLSRVHNSGLILGSYENEHAALSSKMIDTLDEAA